jgi:hypothetical protein
MCSGALEGKGEGRKFVMTRSSDVPDAREGRGKEGGNVRAVERGS